MPITAHAYRALNLTLRLHCRSCDHAANLDLPGLIARGYGDRDLDDLRFRCRLCGGRNVGWIVGAETRKGLIFGATARLLHRGGASGMRHSSAGPSLPVVGLGRLPYVAVAGSGGWLVGFCCYYSFGVFSFRNEN
jgi:hypothetical protein